MNLLHPTTRLELWIIFSLLIMYTLLSSYSIKDIVTLIESHKGFNYMSEATGIWILVTFGMVYYLLLKYFM